MDYGVDWTGPNGYCQPDVVVPEVQLQRSLTQQEIQRLPKPDGPLSSVSDTNCEPVIRNAPVNSGFKSCKMQKV